MDHRSSHRPVRTGRCERFDCYVASAKSIYVASYPTFSDHLVTFQSRVTFSISNDSKKAVTMLSNRPQLNLESTNKMYTFYPNHQISQSLLDPFKAHTHRTTPY